MSARPTEERQGDAGLPEASRRRLQVQRAQIGGLLIIAAGLALFTLLRAQPHTLFPAGWWRFW